MTETDILQQIRLAVGRKPDLRLFRNNCGMLYDATGRPVRYGVGQPGGSDLIGWRTVTIRPEMVGQQVAVFTAAEVKVPGWKPRNPADRERFDQQMHFIDCVLRAGGIAGVVRSADDALRLVGEDP